MLTIDSNYIENDFYPAWLPLRYRNIIDLSKLAEPSEQIIREANALMEILNVNIAIYKQHICIPNGSSNGLCEVFKSAILQDEQLECLNDTEQRLGNCIIVAYANPLQHHTQINFSDLFKQSL